MSPPFITYQIHLALNSIDPCNLHHNENQNLLPVHVIMIMIIIVIVLTLRVVIITVEIVILLWTMTGWGILIPTTIWKISIFLHFRPRGVYVCEYVVG